MRIPSFLFVAAFFFCTGCTTTLPDNTQAITLAPTAVTLPLERDHHDVLDSRAPLDRWVCLRSEERQWVSVLVELSEAKLTGELTLYDPSGVPIDQTPIQKGRRIYEMEGQAPVGSPSLCGSMTVEEGWSMVRLRWRGR